MKALPDGRVALVTGGSRGSGAATAALLARHGARVATPEDVAGAILLLASGQAGFVTGTSLPVSGGMLLH